MTNSDPLEAQARKVLNSHGYSFHQAVLRVCALLEERPPAPFRLLLSECHVELNGRHASVDLVLQRDSDDRRFLIGECKRPHHSRARWLFARSTHTRGGAGTDSPVISVLSREDSRVFDRPSLFVGASDPYHIGLELKTDDEKDNEGGHASTAINEALTQVFRGTSGFLVMLAAEQQALLNQVTPTPVIPAVYTTAELLVTDTDLGASDLRTGLLESAPVRVVPWLWFQSNLTRDLRPSLKTLPVHSRVRPEATLSSTVFNRFTRAAAIVHADAMIGFLQGLGDQRVSWI